MTSTPNLALPYLDAAQAQKHVTVNQALDRLDSIVQLSVISRALTVPPATPAEGDRYIVAAGTTGATGAWAGWDDSVVEFTGGAWARLIPRTGWLAMDQAVGGMISYDANTGWAPLQTSVSKFTGLSDTPADLTGQAGKTLKVNTGETALEFVTPATGGGAGGPVTYNPFQKRVAIPLASQFATAKSTTGAAGTLTDDPVNGLSVSSTSGTEAARLITVKALPASWEVIEFAIASNQSTVTWGSNGFVLMGAAGSFITIGVGSDGISLPSVRVLKWLANGTFSTAIQNGIAWEGWSGYFRLIRRGGKIIVYHSYDGAAWAYTGTIDETADLGGPALFVGPSANKNTTLTTTYYADADVVPQFAGFVGAGGGSAPVLADATLAKAPSGAATGAHVAEILLSGLSGASVTSTIAIPDRAIVLGVSTRTVTAITGATAYDCGIAGTPNKFGGSLGVAAGSTNVGVIGPQAFYAATPIVLTAQGGNFAGGAVRIAIHCLLPIAPLS